MKPEVIGYITQVHCRGCGERFPVFTFSADTDMTTNGLVSLTRTDNKNIAIVASLQGETLQLVQDRVGAPYRTSEATYMHHPGKPGVSFQEFRKSYQPPTASYTCIFCAGAADVVATESVSEFEAHNKIEVLA